MALVAGGMVSGCGDVQPTGAQDFRIRIENVAPFQQLKSGTASVPLGLSAPGPIHPGEAFEFQFTAGAGHRLSFVSMLGQSNDWFLGTEPEGLALFEHGEPVSGDVTARLSLWDAGTEVNEEPGVGPHTGPRQADAPDGPGAADPDPRVRRLGTSVQLDNGDTFNLPPIASMIRVTLTPSGQTFTVRIENVSDALTLHTSEGPSAVGFSPVVWAVADGTHPLFTPDEADRGHGLEALAESGDVSQLEASLRPLSGLATPVSAGVLVVHRDRAPLFTLGQADRGEGLEALVEDGRPEAVGQALDARVDTDASLRSVAIFDVPVGRENPAAALPGQAFELTFSASPGDRLSLASMFAWSNDWFFATPEAGIALFDLDGAPISGPLSGELRILDLGTERSEEPGIGHATGAQQPGPNVGDPDTDTRVREVTGAEYPLPASGHVRVTIEPING